MNRLPFEPAEEALDDQERQRKLAEIQDTLQRLWDKIVYLDTVKYGLVKTDKQAEVISDAWEKYRELETEERYWLRPGFPLTKAARA